MTWSLSARALSAAALLLAAVSACLLAAGSSPVRLAADVGGVDVGVHLDVLATVLLGFVGCLGWLVALYAGRNVAGQPSGGRFGALQLLAVAGLLLLVTGASLPVMAVGWTVSGMALAALVAHTGAPSALQASRYVRRVLLAGDAALWTAVVVALLVLPTVDRAELPTADLPAAPTTVVVLLVLAACVVRSALVPAHRWLPETAEAPSPVSALLHAGIVNGAGVLLTLLWPLVAAAPVVLLLLVVLGALSVAAGTVAARVRVDVKGRLACSTTTQMGYMSVQVGLGLPAAAVLHLVGHGFWKSWLFLRAGGAVSRLRQDGGDGVGTRWAPRSALLAVPAVGGMLLLAAPALVHSWDRLGPVTVVPALLAAAAVAVAAASTSRPAPGRAPTPGPLRLGVAAAAAAAGAAYLWLVVGAEVLLHPSLPTAPVWSPPVAAALVGLLVVAVLALLVVLRRLDGPVRHLAVLLAGSALAPWTRHVPGSAALPRLEVQSPGAATVRAATRDAATMDAATVDAAVGAAVADLAPAWPLRTMVAASALAGLEHLPVERAGEVADALLGTDGLLPAAGYDRLLRTGRLGADDLAAAVRLAALDDDRAMTDAEVDWTVEGLLLAGAGGTGLPRAAVPAPGTTHPSLCRLADALEDGRDGGDDLSAGRLRRTREDHASLWCQRAWARADSTGPGPWQLWLAHATLPSYDLALRLSGARRFAAGLPADPAAALGVLLAGTGLTGDRSAAYLRGLLADAPGWCGHALWRSRGDSDRAAVLELLALRAALDALVAGSRHRVLPAPAVDAAAQTPVDDAGDASLLERRDPRHLWQLAYELGYGSRLLESLQQPARRLASQQVASPAAGQRQDRPEVQWVACIDVRSERVRRHLEVVGDVETFGFAGFFGVDLHLRTADGVELELCPALLRPSVPCTTTPAPARLRPALSRAVAAVAAAPLTPLLLAEAGGALAGAAALGRTAAPSWWARVAGTPVDRFGGSGLELDLDLPGRVALAAGALRGTGLVGGLARVVVLCGHGATVQNNAFATAYDCGACGGNPGGLNARALAGLLNDPAVRRGLADQGLVVPDGTLFLAAMHDTTTDELLLDPVAEVPAGHRELLGRLWRWTVAAAAAVREERLALLPGGRPGPDGPGAAAEARRRSQDWAQPFPEWGLAGNAAVVVGPRALSRGVDLGGRVFLHSYDAALDPDGSVLETVLTAPVVVAHWISSQYRLSTVAPEVLGAGDKTSHNVVGDVGVLSGAHGDLRTGLPWQALFAADPRLDPGSARHEPLRLLVLVHAAADAVQHVLSRHDDLADLARNGWLRLVSVDPSDGRMRLLTRGGRWVGWGAGGALDPATTGEVTAEHATSEPDGSLDRLVQPRALAAGAVSTGAVSTGAVSTGAATTASGGALTPLG